MTRKDAIEHRVEPATAPRVSTRSRRGHVGRRLMSRPVAPAGAGISDELVLGRLGAEIRDVHRRLTAAESAFTADLARFADLERRQGRARSQLQLEHRRSQRVLSGRFGRDQLSLAHSSCPSVRSAPRQGRPGQGIDSGSRTDRAPGLVRGVLLTIELVRQLDTAPPPLLASPFDAPAMATGLENGVRELEATASALEAARAAVAASRSRLEGVLAETDSLLSRSGRLLNRLGRLAEEPRTL